MALTRMQQGSVKVRSDESWGPRNLAKVQSNEHLSGKYLVHASLTSAFVAHYPEKAKVHSQTGILSKSCLFKALERAELQNTETEGKEVRQINDIFLTDQ